MNKQTEVVGEIGRYRWLIISLLLFATTINYMDRNVISFLKEYFCSPQGFGWSNTDFANLTSIFTAFYAGVTLFSGALIDKIGTKLGLAFSLIIWSLAGIGNAFVGKLVGMHMMIRSVFAVGESGNFPASIKTVAEWFPKKERALATGIFNSGSNIGAMISALFVPWCLLFFGADLGWKMSFILTGGVGFIWLIFWFWIYDTPAKAREKGVLSEAEYNYIHSDIDEKEAAAASIAAGNPVKVSWFKLLTYKQTWSFVVGKFMTDGVWWFLLFWLPDYLTKQFGMTTQQVMWPTFIVFGVAIVGSVFGGGVPLFFMNRGWQTYKARMTAMFLIALFPLLLITTQYFGNVAHFGYYASILAITVISIGAAAHQAWSANLFTTVSDMFPKKAVGAITGIGTAAGGIGGVLLQKLAGWMTDLYAAHPATAYTILFAVCASAYLIAWLIMKWLVPRFRLITDL